MLHRTQLRRAAGGVVVALLATGAVGLTSVAPAAASCSDQPVPALAAAAVPQTGSVLVRWQIRCIGDTPDSYDVQSYEPPATDGSQAPGPIADSCDGGCTSIVMRPAVGQILSYCVTASYVDTTKASTTACTEPTAPAGTVSVDQADQAGIRLRTLGEQTYPDTYATVSVDEPSASVSLKVTQLNAATNALLQAAGSVPITLTLVSRSFNDLMALQQVVINDDAYWTAQGTTLTYNGPDDASDTLTIGVDVLSSAVVTAMQARYGAANITVVQQDPAVPAASRTADSAPFNGGDLVLNGPSSGEACTTGFGVHVGSAAAATGGYLTLAGHCYPNGTAVYQNGTRIGTVSRSASVYKDYGDDIEILSGFSSRMIWETNTARAQSDGSTELLPTGVSVCHSGAATNKKCGTVKATNGCPYFGKPTYLHFCHEDTVTSGSVLSAGGDSGGPWFAAYTSGVRYFSAVGSHSGGAGIYTCNTQLGNNNCTNTSYYLEFDRIYRLYNVWPNY